MLGARAGPVLQGRNQGIHRSADARQDADEVLVKGTRGPLQPCTSHVLGWLTGPGKKKTYACVLLCCAVIHGDPAIIIISMIVIIIIIIIIGCRCIIGTPTSSGQGAKASDHKPWAPGRTRWGLGKRWLGV